MKNIKFAICGFGHIGRRHTTIANEFHGTEVIAVIDTNEELANHELMPVGAQFYTSIDDYLSSGALADVLTVATPNGLHIPFGLKAIEHNHHVVIEKPMGLSRVSCEQLVFLALNKNRHVFVVKQNRYSPPSKWLKEVVSQKIIGDTLMVQVNCYWNRDDRYYKPGGWKGTKDLDGGVLFTQFSHFIDIMFWVFGDITNIKTNLKNFNHQTNTEFEDSGNTIFEFVNGGMGCINFSTSVWDTNMESSITVIGTKGSLKIGGQYMNEIEYCHIDNYEMPTLPPTNPPNDYGPFKGSAANHHYVIENVVNTLNGSDSITANALEGLKVVDIIERIYQAAN
ncbi:MAG: Gfo/Idh/MocA family oxidoreductase [Flavobacteriales bacterium]|nr:Gfo/Idh/MocA family oxidoreductase [Bacteroidota bacterium]MCB9239876.1 Gfo/Idh/MocA family oxidoreductase [Flavobacteriales bacterium]